MSTAKDLKKTLNELQAKGYEIWKHKGHFKIKSPGGKTFSCSGSPSCPHAHKNLLSDLKKYDKSI